MVSHWRVTHSLWLFLYCCFAFWVSFTLGRGNENRAVLWGLGFAALGFALWFIGARYGDSQTNEEWRTWTGIDRSDFGIEGSLDSLDFLAIRVVVERARERRERTAAPACALRQAVSAGRPPEEVWRVLKSDEGTYSASFLDWEELVAEYAAQYKRRFPASRLDSG